MELLETPIGDFNPQELSEEQLHQLTNYYREVGSICNLAMDVELGILENEMFRRATLVDEAKLRSACAGFDFLEKAIG